MTLFCFHAPCINSLTYLIIWAKGILVTLTLTFALLTLKGIISQSLLLWHCKPVHQFIVPYVISFLDLMPRWHVHRMMESNRFTCFRKYVVYVCEALICKKALSVKIIGPLSPKALKCKKIGWPLSIIGLI